MNEGGLLMKIYFNDLIISLAISSTMFLNLILEMIYLINDNGPRYSSF